MISQVGVDRVMLGSDYCLDMGCERPFALLDELKISDADRKLIAGETAAGPAFPAPSVFRGTTPYEAWASRTAIRDWLSNA
jgi:hypothetical protein